MYKIKSRHSFLINILFHSELHHITEIIKEVHKIHTSDVEKKKKYEKAKDLE